MSRLPRLLALAAGLAALGACSDSPSAPRGDPHDDVQVQVTAGITAPTFTAVNDSVTVLECTLTLQASATGPAGAAAEWAAAKFLFYVGPDRNTPSDTAEVGAEDMKAGWGAVQIAVGGAQTSQWILRASVPFALGGELQYRTVGGTTTHVARFDPVNCGPSVPAGAAPPTVSNLQVSPAGGEMETSDSITVSWQATAPAGIWESLITVVTGSKTARYLTRGAFQTADSRTVKVRLPYGAGLGSAAQVSVTVTDSWLRSASGGPRATSTVVDRTPPQLLLATTTESFANTGEQLRGQYGTGDSLKVWIVATDENGLANLVWDLGAPVSERDSLPVTGVPGAPVSIPVKPGWAGAARLRVWVTDRGGNASQVFESAADAIRFYPVISRPTQGMALPGGYRDVALDPVARKVYLAMEATQRIVPVSIGTMTAGPPIALPGYASAVDLTPGRDSLVVALPDQKALALVDLASSQVTVVQVDAPGLTGPHALRLGANGRVVAGMAASSDGHDVVVEIDRRTGAVQQKGTGQPGYTYTMRMRATPDRSRIGLRSGCVYIYQVSTGALGECLPGGMRANFALDAQGQIYSDAEHVYSAAAGGLFSFDQLPVVTSSAPGPDGIYASSTRGLLRARTDGAILDRSALPLMYGDLLFLDGGNTLVGFTNDGVSDNRMFVVTLH